MKHQTLTELQWQGEMPKYSDVVATAESVRAVRILAGASDVSSVDPGLLRRWLSPTSHDWDDLAENMAVSISRAAQAGNTYVAVFSVPLGAFDAAGNRHSPVAIPRALAFARQIWRLTNGGNFGVNTIELYEISPCLLRWVIEAYVAQIYEARRNRAKYYSLGFHASGGVGGEGATEITAVMSWD